MRRRELLRSGGATLLGTSLLSSAALAGDPKGPRDEDLVVPVPLYKDVVRPTGAWLNHRFPVLVPPARRPESFTDRRSMGADLAGWIRERLAASAELRVWIDGEPVADPKSGFNVWAPDWDDDGTVERVAVYWSHVTKPKRPGPHTFRVEWPNDLPWARSPSRTSTYEIDPEKRKRLARR
ncbi:MAG: hypothetical protein ABEJ08_02595 [Halobacteriaceae archaeon]